MIGPLICLILGLTVIFAIFFFLPEGWLGWLLGLFVASGWLVAGALLASTRSPPLGLLFSLAPFALAPLTSSVAGRLRRWLNPPSSRDEFTLRDEALHRLIGRRGRAMTPLRPAGSVEFDGRRLDGISEGVFIDGGTLVSAVRVRGRFLVVCRSRTQRTANYDSRRKLTPTRGESGHATPARPIHPPHDDGPCGGHGPRPLVAHGPAQAAGEGHRGDEAGRWGRPAR